MGKPTRISLANREEWLAARKKGIGGSDASALLGLNPYSSPLRVYLDKIVGELTSTMTMCGCATLADITRDKLWLE